MWHSFVSWVEWHHEFCVIVVQILVLGVLAWTLKHVVKYARAARETADDTKPLAELATVDLETRYIPTLLFGAYPRGSKRSNVVGGGWYVRNTSAYDAIAQPQLRVWLDGQELSVPEQSGGSTSKDFSGEKWFIVGAEGEEVNRAFELNEVEGLGPILKAVKDANPKRLEHRIEMHIGLRYRGTLPGRNDEEKRIRLRVFYLDAWHVQGVGIDAEWIYDDEKSERLAAAEGN